MKVGEYGTLLKVMRDRFFWNEMREPPAKIGRVGMSEYVILNALSCKQFILLLVSLLLTSRLRENIRIRCYKC